MQTAAQQSRLPRFTTPFIGREHEISHLIDMLGRDDTPLVTLVGPGGSGKTRLAVEIAQTIVFDDGIYFIALQPLHSVDHIVTTIVDALSLQLSGSGDPHRENWLITRGCGTVFAIKNGHAAGPARFGI